MTGPNPAWRLPPRDAAGRKEPRLGPSGRRPPGFDESHTLGRRGLVLVVAAALLSACTSASPTATTQPPPAEGAGTPMEVLDQARDLAEQLEQREAQLGSIAP